MAEPTEVRPMTEQARLTCPYCGTENDDDAIFCGKCGKDMRTAGVATSQGPSTAQPSEAAQPPAKVEPALPSRVEQGGPTLAEQKSPLGTGTITGTPPGAGASAEDSVSSSGNNPTLMSETPIRGSDLEAALRGDSAGTIRSMPAETIASETSTATNPGMPAQRPAEAVLQTAPSKSVDSANKGAATVFGGSTLKEGEGPNLREILEEGKSEQAQSPSSSEPSQQESPQSGATPATGSQSQVEGPLEGNQPPLSPEAKALLERFAGSNGTLGKPVKQEKSQASGAPAAPSGPMQSTLPGLPAVSIGEPKVTEPAQKSVEPESEPEKADTTAQPASFKQPKAADDSAIGKTMLGMPVPEDVRKSSSKPEPPRQQPPQQISSTSPFAPPSAPSKPPAGDEGGMTMLGMPTPVSPKESSKSAESAKPSGMPASDEGGMTMLGLPSPAKQQPSVAPAPQAPSAEPSRGRAVAPTDSLAPEPRKKSRAGLVVVVIILALLLGAAGAYAIVAFIGGEPYAIEPEVVVGGDLARITLTVEPALAGTKLRFAGQEQTLEDGRAAFELRAKQLSVGRNELPVEIVEPGGGTRSTKVIFDLSFRAVADLSGLKAQPPHYAVRFQVMEGTKLKVAGQSVELDQQGVYVHRVPLDEALAGAVDAGKSVVHRVPFTVQVKGDPPRSESVDTAIPRTPLRIQAPTKGAIVDVASIACVGQTDPAAEVLVNGEKVAQTKGRFTHEVPLPSVGEHQIEVIAEAPGKVRQVQRIKVRRTATLTPLIREFAATVDLSLTYPRVMKNLDELRGRPIRFHGQIVALEARPSETFMQLLVDEGCPADERCSIHVTYGGTTKVERFAKVTVYGNLSGRWEGKTRGGKALVMPSIQARFVVPDSSR